MTDNEPGRGLAGAGWSRRQFLHGSALGMAVSAGPDGSQFVSPSSLPADTAAAPLERSATGNYYAGSANIATVS